MCARGREDPGGQKLPGPLLETELRARLVAKSRSLTGSFERKEVRSVGKKLTLLGRAGGSRESRGTVIS